MELLDATEEAEKVFSECAAAFEEKNVVCEFSETTERKIQNKKY